MRNSALVALQKCRMPMSGNDIMAVMRASYIDGWGNATDSILDALSEEKVTEGLRVALSKDEALRKEMQGANHEEIVLAYRGIFEFLRKIVERNAPVDGAA